MSINGSEADFFLHNVPADLLEGWSIFSWMLLSGGAILNGFNLFVLLLHCCRFRFSPTRNQLLILFIHDLLLSAFFYPAIVENLAHGNHGVWNNVELCQVFGFCNIFCSIHTTFLGAQIALFRAFMSSQNYSSNHVLEQKQRMAVRIMTSTTSVIGLLTASIPFVFPDEMEIKPPYGFCGPNTHQYGKGIQIVKMVLWVFIPSTIALISYLKIYLDLNRRRNAFQDPSPGQSLQDERRLTASFNASYQCLGSEGTVTLNLSTSNRNYDRNCNRAGNRLRRLSRKMLALLLTKLIAHMPMALFYILTTRENRDPILNLIITNI
ncbi:hypothetical protein RvY_13411 [Ramazzottius varieornatus]|uniref:G-protein coupled receptors family 1 profile domain-containing protein n=1 Tax=Ramazzottius varieornatus TaxID=947166 RepID=A0A1D1VMT5_RAMVA|nr:hypothetical protein RvY_13411 [Ramazzottius varieornatus]